ncbi:hypothetical protein ACTFNM_22415 [Bacillus cereus group sp. BCN115]|uniref:hypothetical protein n=1 Tax=Bacillus cereus group sp. BCN115 TaxID=3450575 RepID=UPI003F7A0914
MDSIIAECIREYIDILAKTIIRDHVLNNQEALMKILQDSLTNILQDDSNDDSNDEDPKTLSMIILDYMMPKQSYDSTSDLISSTFEEVNSNHYRLIATSAERLALQELGFPQNEVLDKKKANELLTKIKKKYIYELEQELKQYNPEMLLYSFYGIANQLAVLSTLTFYKVNTTDVDEFPFEQGNPFSILTALVATMDTNAIMQTSTQIGREKQLIDIIFNLIYKLYINQPPEEVGCSQTKIDIRKIYQLAYMVMKSNLLLKSNELLYEQGEFLRIQDWTLEQSGNFEEKMYATLLDIVNFNYKKDIVNEVFKQYSKREGFCPNDLNNFIKLSSQDQQAYAHLKTYDKEYLEDIILQVTSVKEHGIKRFFDVLTLKKGIKEITDSSNKLSVLPFVELDNNKILYSDYLLAQAKQALSTRMLQQSFTTNKKLQDFISTKYDEAGIKDLVNELEEANLPYLEHVHLDKIKKRHIKELLNPKGITKEFDLVFIKNNILYVIEYKTWKISSHNIMQILNEQKKIINNIKKHKKAIEIIKAYPYEFKELFGEEFNEYSEVELIMVFQNPTAFKYLNNSKDVKVSSPEKFNEFITSL